MKRSKADNETIVMIYRLSMRKPTGQVFADKVLDQARLFVRMEKAVRDSVKLKGLVK